MRIIINITTYNRPKMLLTLLQQIKDQFKGVDYKLNVYDDASDLCYKKVEKFLNGMENANYIRFTENHGKQYYWKLHRTMYQNLKNEKFDYYIQLQDDLELVDNFYPRVINYLENLNLDALNFLVVHEHNNVYTKRKLSKKSKNGIKYWNISILDCNFIAKPKILQRLKYTCPEIPQKRWQTNPAFTSGVSGAITKAVLRNGGANIKQLVSSLVYHKGAQSVMNMARAKHITCNTYMEEDQNINLQTPITVESTKNKNLKVDKKVTSTKTATKTTTKTTAKTIIKNTKYKPISIIITAYQTQDYIKETLDSIEQQNYFKNNNNFEVLVGVDGCKETLEKLKKIKHKYRNLRIFMSEKNEGTYVITNSLLKRVKNENILRFDSDDIMMKNMVEEMLKCVDEYNFIRCRFTNILVNKNNKQVDSTLFAHGVACYKKELIEQMGGYKPWRCAADTEFFERGDTIINQHLLDKKLFYRRMHDKNLTQCPEFGMKSPQRMKYHDYIFDLRDKKDNGIKIKLKIKPKTTRFREI